MSATQWPATWPCAAQEHVPLAPCTTLKVGGRARWLLEPRNPDELLEAYNACRAAGVVPRVLGGGANLIIADGELDGVVIATRALSRTFRPLVTDDVPTDAALDLEGDGAGIREDAAAIGSDGTGDIRAPAYDAANPRLVAWAGASMPGLVRAASELGWTGLEGLIGVPGHLGGGVAMNAGGRWGELFDVLELVRVVTEDGELRDFTREECSPSYRNGGLGALGAALVVGAVLRLEVDTKAAVRERGREFLLEKRAAQPVTEASAGCIFKNPDATFEGERVGAGLLIDKLGLKGRRRGAARISPLHGNFMINEGGATATDVIELIREVRAEVVERTGILLEIEVQRWGVDL